MHLNHCGALLQARYVQLRMQLSSQEQLRQQKAGLSLLGPRSLELHAEGNNAERETKLRMACIKLATKLGLGLST